MKIIIVTGKPLSEAGGYQTYTKQLFLLLKELGHKPQLVSLPFQPPGIPYMAGLPLFSCYLAWRIQQVVQKSTDVLVFGIGPWSLAGAIYKLWNKRARLFSYYPTTIQHEYAGYRKGTNSADYSYALRLKTRLLALMLPFYNWCEAFTLSRVDQLIVHYQSASQILQKQYNLKPEKFSYFPDYVPLSPAHRVAHKNQVPEVLLICRHDGRKGINIFLHACAELEKMQLPYHATIIGDGELFTAHAHLFKKLQLQHVTLKGRLKNTRPFLEQASMYVVPSFEEGSSSFSLLEAMAAGLPVIASNVDGIPEDIKDGLSGLLVEAGNIRSLTHALQQLLLNPVLRTQLGKNARQAVQKNHNKALMKTGLKKLIAKCH